MPSTQKTTKAFREAPAASYDHYKEVYDAVLAMLRSTESQESLDDAINAAFSARENELHEQEFLKEQANA